MPSLYSAMTYVQRASGVSWTPAGKTFGASFFTRGMGGDGVPALLERKAPKLLESGDTHIAKKIRESHTRHLQLVKDREKVKVKSTFAENSGTERFEGL